MRITEAKCEGWVKLESHASAAGRSERHDAGVSVLASEGLCGAEYSVGVNPEIGA
jgi:hypothetical protein